MSSYYYGFRPYVSVAQRQRQAESQMKKLAKKGATIRPIRIEGRKIANSFWGKSWCENLERYSDFENRLPRGRTYVRNGSVVHLDILPGRVEAMVSGSSLYKVVIELAAVKKKAWQQLCQECAGGIGSIVELLKGKLSDRVMSIITRPSTGLFPTPVEIKMECSCPDWATMCKHVAAVLYGVGARLDESPELLFRLRAANYEDLISRAARGADLTAKVVQGAAELAEAEIGEVFGIELDTAPVEIKAAAPAPVKHGRKTLSPKTRKIQRPRHKRGPRT